MSPIALRAAVRSPNAEWAYAWSVSHKCLLVNLRRAYSAVFAVSGFRASTTRRPSNTHYEATSPDYPQSESRNHACSDRMPLPFRVLHPIPRHPRRVAGCPPGHGALLRDSELRPQSAQADFGLCCLEFIRRESPQSFPPHSKPSLLCSQTLLATTREQHLTEIYRLFMTKKGELSSYNMGEEFQLTVISPQFRRALPY
jgi:hypothetical protein